MDTTYKFASMKTEKFSSQSFSEMAAIQFLCAGCECSKKKTKCCKKYKRGGKHCGSCPKK
jgi:hypothetical protein